MKRSLLFLSLLLLVALALCLAACGEGEPAETSNLPVTSCGTTTVSTPEATTVTTAEATTVTTSTMNTTIGDVFPFLFYTLSDLDLYLTESPEDLTLYKVFPIGGNSPYQGAPILLESFLPELANSSLLFENASVYFDESFFGSHGYLCCYTVIRSPRYDGIMVDLSSVDSITLPTPQDGEVHEWNAELEYLLIKKDDKLDRAIFYALDGYRVTIWFPATEEGRTALLASDAVELREILENPTFSCERLRIISEALRAMNEE